MGSVDSGSRVANDVEPAGLGRWLDLHALAMLLTAAAGAGLGTAAPIVAAAIVSFAIVWRLHWPHLARVARFGGYANALTASRLAIVLAVAAVMTRVPAALVLLVFAVNVALDVADGRVARRRAETTVFGSVLDRETDALFVLVAYLYFFLTQGVGAWVLAPGLMPYLYRLVARALRGRPIDEERQPLAVTLAGVNYGILLVAVAAPPRLALALLAVSFIVVILSFAASSLRFLRMEALPR